MTAQPDLMGVINEAARRSLLRYTTETFEGYQVNWHHELICEYLDAFVKGDITRLMIFMPPQTGKSELASRRFPTYMLGKNPDLKIAIASYNTTKAQKFNQECQRIMDTNRYQEIFPDTKLGGRMSGYTRSLTEFEIVGYKGKLFVTGIRSTFTGESVDILIADDLVKDKIEAQSPTIQLRNIDWWDSVAMNRLHNASKVLLLMTRWDAGDIPGRILTRMRHGDCEKFEILILPSIKENNNNPEDPREIGEALWPKRHSKKSIKEKEKSNKASYRALHQQDPSVPTEFKIWAKENEETGVTETWKKIQEMPGHDKFYGLDFGFSNNPTGIIECQHHKGKGYVKELFYEPGKTNPELAGILKALGVTHEVVVCDGAEPKSIQELKDKGINAVAGLHCANSVNTQILFLQGIDMHYVPTKGNLEFELENHQWQAGPDGPINLEIDKHNHLTKAAMYAFYRHCHKAEPGIEVFYPGRKQK